MPIARFDHVALPTRQPEPMIRFYRALGFSTPDPEGWEARGESFFSVHYGDLRINFHAPSLFEDPGFSLRGPSAAPGCGDLCFVWDGTMAEVQDLLEAAGARIEAGPVEMVGGRNEGRNRGESLYTRDPDANLLEFIVYSD